MLSRLVRSWLLLSRLMLSSLVLALLVMACTAGSRDGESAAARASSEADPANEAGPASEARPANEAGKSGSSAVGPAPSPSGSAEWGEAPATASADAVVAPPGEPARSTAACAADMVLIEGDYCPDVMQSCREHHREWTRAAERLGKLTAKGEKETTTASERCLAYEAPSRCVSKKRRHKRYCIDRYEWPNEKGALPSLLVSWHDAKSQCASVGKRLCMVDEFDLACEGEAMLPYTYGYERDATKCNIDKPYRKREKALKRAESCARDEGCKAEFARLDQREPAGSRPECVSPFGVHDMNGNANEWVERPNEEPPNRSGLKGGWWGPVRGRCRPTVGFHKESDYGYEVGFRCCADVRPAAERPTP
ncbi:MAG: hypothetical protein EXR75_01350 [Myxococcales bacterium]|nr:hypothetical protein [Myxococcales bacterium]